MPNLKSVNSTYVRRVPRLNILNVLLAHFGLFLGVSQASFATQPTQWETQIRDLLPVVRGATGANGAQIENTNEQIKSILFQARESYPRRSQTPLPYANSQQLSAAFKEDILLHEPILQIARFGSAHSHGAYLVSFEGGFTALFKPLAGEADYSTHNLQSQYIFYIREVEAYPLIESVLHNRESRLHGFSSVEVPPIVEVALYHNGTSYGIGSLQWMMRGYQTFEQIQQSNQTSFQQMLNTREAQDTLARVRMFDVLLGNNDRLATRSNHNQANLGNLMAQRGPDGRFRFAMIDNARGRIPSPVVGIDEAPVRGDLPEDLRRYVATTIPFHLEEHARQYLSAPCVAGLRTRLEWLIQRYR